MCFETAVKDKHSIQQGVGRGRPYAINVDSVNYQASHRCLDNSCIYATTDGLVFSCSISLDSEKDPEVAHVLREVFRQHGGGDSDATNRFLKRQLHSVVFPDAWPKAVACRKRCVR